MRLVIGLYWTPGVRHEALFDREGMKGSLLWAVAAADEAGGSLILESQGKVGAAPTKTEQVGTAKRSGSGECDGKVYVRNQ